MRDSINGVITYNTPSEYNGFTFENVRLTFKDGKIVDCDGNDKARLEQVFNTDEGARYVGEFAIGVNPYITKSPWVPFFSMKRLLALSISPPATAMRMPPTAINPPSIGIWC